MIRIKHKITETPAYNVNYHVIARCVIHVRIDRKTKYKWSYIVLSNNKTTTKNPGTKHESHTARTFYRLVEGIVCVLKQKVTDFINKNLLDYDIKRT